MGERRASTTGAVARPVAAFVALAVIAAAVYWFVIRDGNGSSKPTTALTSQTKPQTFNQQGVPFTFEYPANFAEAPAPEGFVWIAGISPSDIIDVRKVDPRTYSARGLDTIMGSRLELQTGTKGLESETVKGEGLDVVRYQIQTGADPKLQSTLLFFSTDDATWQIECQSQPQNASVIDAACAQALTSLRKTTP